MTSSRRAVVHQINSVLLGFSCRRLEVYLTLQLALRFSAVWVVPPPSEPSEVFKCEISRYGTIKSGKSSLKACVGLLKLCGPKARGPVCYYLRQSDRCDRMGFLPNVALHFCRASALSIACYIQS